MRLLEFKKVADMLAKEYKIKIEEGQGWAANIDKRIVFYVKNDVYNLPEEHILGFLLHETAHIHYTTISPKQPKNPELFHSVENMIEDISIENIISKDYPNAGEILASTKEEVLDTLVKILPKLEKSLHEKSLLYAAARFEGRGFAKGQANYEIIGNKIVKIMNKNKNEILNRKKTQDLKPIIEEIIELLLKEAGEPTEQEKRDMKGNSDQLESQGQQQQNTTKDGIIRRLKAGTGWNSETSICKNMNLIDEIADQAAQIGKQLRTVLKRNNSMEFGGRYRSGKLIAKRFVRIKVLKDRNPFARRIVKSNQSYAFALASDVSGSMFSGRQDPASYALSSLFMVGEALRCASIPRAMIIFGTRAVTATEMGKTQIRWEDLASEKKIKKADQNDTDIAAAMKLCEIELNKTRAERKIMIILTDGQSDRYEIEQQYISATKKGIECLGITLGSGGYLEEVFEKGKNTTIEDTSDTTSIGKAFINILKESVKKSL